MSSSERKAAKRKLRIYTGAGILVLGVCIYLFISTIMIVANNYQAGVYPFSVPVMSRGFIMFILFFLSGMLFSPMFKKIRLFAGKPKIQAAKISKRRR